MRRSWWAALCCGAIVTVLPSCPAPYRPFCKVGESRVLSSNSTGELHARARGEVTRLSVLQGRRTDGGATASGQVETFDRAGAPIGQYAIEIAAGFSTLFGQVTFVDTPEGIALITTTFQQELRADGGRDLFEQRFLELRSRDGGTTPVELADAGCRPACSICDCLQSGVAGVSRVSDSVVVDELSSGFGFTPTHRLRAFGSDGQRLGALDVPSAQVMPGPDAIAVYPGPQLFSDQLAPLSTAPETASNPGTATWSVAQNVMTIAYVDGTNLLTQSFDFSGASLGDAQRVSDAYGVAAVARSANGTGILFDAYDFEPDAGRLQRWFAFVDRNGKKKGPDVAVPSGTLLTSSELDDRFAIFTLGRDGLERTEVVCE